MMNAKLTLALVAAGMLGLGMCVKAEEAAASTTATATTATTVAPTAAADTVKKGKPDAFLKMLKKKHPADFAKYEETKKTDAAAAEQMLADLKAKYSKDKKAKK